ncbi:MAG: ABC transporter substrate-binding protein [Candidatus Bathyarchaeota archaeon]|nr:ABC transporter substrate-binding protein [Candidatus Bathyarchaeota archaeon]
MENQKTIIIVAFLVVVIAGGAYQISRNQDVPLEETQVITVIDCLNRTVQIETPIERIIFTGRGHALTVSVAYLFDTAPEKIIGLSTDIAGSNLFSVVDPSSSEKVVEGASDMGVEEIAAQDPDVVVLKSYLKSDVGDPLESLGVKVVYLDLENLEQYARDVETMGALMGEPEKAESIIEYYQSTYTEVEARHTTTTDAPSVLFLYYNVKGGTASFMSPGADWLQTIVTKTAGGNPLSLELEGTGWNNVNVEQIAEWNPEVIFIVTYKPDPSCMDVENLIKSDELWQNIDAVKNDRVYSVPDDCFGTATIGSWDTSGSRWILGLRWMEAKINGDDTGLLEDVEEFYVDLYGLSSSEADTVIDSIVGDI